MAVSLGASWPAAVTLLAGAANLYLTWVVWKYRDRPGGKWFTVVAGLMATVCLLYGAALLVFAPRWLRMALEAAHWVAGVALVGSWVAFALAYTGRGYLLRTRGAWVAAGVLGLLMLIPVTHPYHDLFWTGFRITPVFGAATATFAVEEGMLVGAAVIMVPVAASGVLLVDTLISYGSLFRSQTVALFLTQVFPVCAALAYVFRLGPVPELNLIPVALLPHAVLDIYALFGAEMFEFDPATRRIGERTATDDLGTPVVTVDTAGRIIALNDAAVPLLGPSKRAVTGEDIDERLDATVPLGDDATTIDVRVDGRRRQYRVVPSPFTDETGTRLGYNLVFQDVTEVVQREQRLEVMNRVLRHNLRNELSVVTGNAEIVVELAEDSQIHESGETIRRVSRRLSSFGERAREFDRIIDAATAPGEPVVVADVLRDVAAEVRGNHPAVSLTIDVPETLALRQPRSVLRLVFANLLDNAVAHNDRDEPQVTVRATDVTDSGSAHFAVEDDGPGIPDVEVTVIEAEEETPLEHGSGLGLWVVQSGVTAMGGDVAFATGDDRGTTVSLRIPDAVER